MSENTKAEENKNRVIGCLAIVALAILISGAQAVWGWISDSTTEKVPYEITIELNQGMTDRFVLGGSDCNLNDDYEVTIYGRDDGQDQVDQKSWGRDAKLAMCSANTPLVARCRGTRAIQ